MKFYKSILLSALVVTAFSCKDNKTDAKDSETVEEDVEVTTDATEESDEKMIEFMLDSKSGSTASGRVSFKERDGVVYMEAKLSGLSEGTHAIHLHEKADCSSDDGKSSGGHWNPTFEQHGSWGSADGYHRGDIGNFEANSSGEAAVMFSTDEWCIGCFDSKKNIIGKAVIVHQGEDDLTSQPSGAAGARISCGGVIQ